MPQFDPSAFWGIAGIVVGIIVATVFFLLGKKKTLLQYAISTTPLVTEKMAAILNDRMSIDGQPVKSLLSTTITFFNAGNQRITSLDFSRQEPLRIILKGHLYGHDVSLGNQKLLPKIELVNDKVLNISFENLKPRQFFRVTILHDETDETLEVLGELTTGTTREFSSNSLRGVPFAMAAIIIEAILAFDSVFDGPIIEIIFSSDFTGVILIAIVTLMLILCGAFLVANRPPLLRDDYDDTNESNKEDRNFLKTISRIFRK